jgi:hypothetical protein
MGLRSGILIRIRKKHIRIGNKFDCVEGVKSGNWKWAVDPILVNLKNSTEKVKISKTSRLVPNGFTCKTDLPAVLLSNTSSEG